MLNCQRITTPDSHHLQVSWLTPAEIFQPFYGHAVAAALLEKLPQKQPLDIIEVGGGSGRLARDFLVGILSRLSHHWLARKPNVYYPQAFI
jgi:SAM-dependent MidA family methyltransferase